MNIEEIEKRAYDRGFEDGRRSREVGPLVGYARKVVELVCDYFDVEFTELKSPCRKQTLAYPRQVIMYFLRKNTKMGPVAIAQTFNRNHGTVRKAVRAVDDRIDTNEYQRRDIQILSEKIMQCLHT